MKNLHGGVLLSRPGAESERLNADTGLITTEFAEWGVVFQNGTHIVQHGVIADAPSPPNVIQSDALTFDAYFVCPINPVMPGTVAWFEITQDWGAQSGGGTLEGYDLDENLIYSQAFNTSGGTFRIENVGPIHRVRVASCNDGLDNFSYGEITLHPRTVHGSAAHFGGGWV